MSTSPAPASPSAEYTVTLNGCPAFVHSFVGFAGGSIAWMKFAFDAEEARPCKVKVTLARQIDQATLHPAHLGIPVTLESPTELTFFVREPGNYFLKTDGEMGLPLYIFALRETPQVTDEQRPLYTGVGEPCIGGWEGAKLPKVISFGPGVHVPGLIRLQSGQTLHLAAGTEVYGAVIAEDASDIRICGAGILRGTLGSFQGRIGESPYMICLRRCRRVVVEGITVLDGFSWNVVAHHCEHVTFRWLQVLSERLYSTDGINPCNSRHVVIEDCFMRTKDDCVAVKGFDWEHPDPRDWAPIHDIVVRRCVMWSDNNNAIVVGCETRAPVIQRVTFEDCTVLTCANTCGDWAAVFSVIALDDTVVRDITFRRIHVERAMGPLFNVYFSDSVFGIAARRLPGGGRIERVRFEDITLDAGPSRRSYVRGLDATRRVGPVEFRNIRVRGCLIHSAADLRLESNAHAHGITFGDAAKPASEPTARGVSEVIAAEVD
jgi:hypothetical protein